MKSMIKALGGLVAAITLTVPSLAATLTLEQLLDPGASITAGDKLFDSWEVTFTDASAEGATWDFGDIDITALDDGGDDPGPGLMIDMGGQMTVTGDGIYAYRDIAISFHVSTIGDKKIKDNLLNFGNPASFLSFLADDLNDLGMAVVEKVYDAAGNMLADKYIEFSLLDGVETRDFPDSAAFAPQDEIWVTKNFLVWAVDDSDTASLGGVEQRFSQQSVPEPGSLALVALALAGLGAAARRRG
ncbi:MAG TPA: PEP-CTERM sorting domain-containing protein [Kiritimatiellia bacterium]|jgi:hypothetical protein|nr:PEP-CTERM sorting domain-containing protein [Burkholderiaceae bacterium]HOO21779.1 PEP-CTERM sorting domain-containing protein [Kiritimatiellia bacterium]